MDNSYIYDLSTHKLLPSGVYKRSKEQLVKLVEHNRRLAMRNRGKKRPPMSEETKNKLRLANTAENNPGWNGGRRTDSRGYKKLRKCGCNSDNYVFEHRLVYDESRSCCLLPWIVIHHKDGNRLNNIWYNLIPMTRSQHTILERKEKFWNNKN